MQGTTAKSLSQQRPGQQQMQQTLGNAMSSPSGNALHQINPWKNGTHMNPNGMPHQQFQSLQRQSQQPSSGGLDLKLTGTSQPGGPTLERFNMNQQTLLNNRQMLQIAPGKKQYPVKVGSSYIHNQTSAISTTKTTSLNLNGESQQTMGAAGGMGSVHQGIKRNTPTNTGATAGGNLGTSSSFVRNAQGPMINGQGLMNQNNRVGFQNNMAAGQQKRGPSAEATMGSGSQGIGAEFANKNLFMAPNGTTTTTMRSQSFNPERASSNYQQQVHQNQIGNMMQASGRQFNMNGQNNTQGTTQMHQIGTNNGMVGAKAGIQAPSRCSGPVSGLQKPGEHNGTSSLQNFKSVNGSGATAQNLMGSVTNSINLSRQLNVNQNINEGKSSSVTRPGIMMAANGVPGPRGASEGQVKSNSLQNTFIQNGVSNQLGTSQASTLLQNRKDQTGANQQLLNQNPNDLSKTGVSRAPSGKDLGHKSLINLQTMSKSVDKQPQNTAASANMKVSGSNGAAHQQQYGLHSQGSKDGKVRESAKRRRDASGAGQSNGGGQVYGNQGATNQVNLKEKRLSQTQAQQFVNNQELVRPSPVSFYKSLSFLFSRFNSNQANSLGRGLLPNLTSSGGAQASQQNNIGGVGSGLSSTTPSQPQACPTNPTSQTPSGSIPPPQNVPLVSCGTTIIIHVCDENKKLNKDFKCDKQLLITNMKYFEKYLSDSKSADDIDISVHCDINIFDWLMRYIHRKEPVIEVKNSVSILISSDFLQMDELVEEALNYVARKISQIIQLPIDMNCMNSGLQKRLAGKLTLWELNDLHDKKDKLKSKLFMKKLEYLFEEEHNMLHRCVNCGSLYTSNQREWIQCPQANLFVDYHGNTIAKHQSDKHWDINKFVMFLRQKQISWQDIFWKMFARLQEFKCTTCDKKFLGAEINHCSYHASKANFMYQENSARYPCCNMRAQRFNSYIPDKGCTSQNHRIKAGSPRKTVAQRAKNYELLMEHFKVACEPFYYSKYDLETKEVVTKPLYADMIDEDRSLLNLVNQFVKQNPKHVQEREAREAKEAKREARLKALEQHAERHLSKNGSSGNAGETAGASAMHANGGDEEKESKNGAGGANSGVLPTENSTIQETTATGKEKSSVSKANKSSNNNQTLSGKFDYLLDCASLEDLSLHNLGGPGKDNGETDINDEMQHMQDLSCFNIFKKRVKKGRKYKEWKKDEIRDNDAEQMKFLEKQIHRMRKKEENQVHRKTVGKRNTTGLNNNHGERGHGPQNGHSNAPDNSYGARPVSTANVHHQGNSGASFGSSNVTGHQNQQSHNGSSNFSSGQGQSNSGVGGSGMGMNMRTRLKYQQNQQQPGHYMQPRQRSNNNGKVGNVLSAHRK